MTGLRELQKQSRRKRILGCARALFLERGFETTSIEAIAEAAELSAVTVYNYYRTKGGVLLALVTQSDSLLIEKIEKLMAKPSDKPLDVVCAFSKTINQHAFSYLNREIWRHVIASSVIESDSEFGQVYQSLDRELVLLLARILAELNGGKAAAKSFDPQTAAEVLYNVHNARFLEYIIDPSRTARQRDSLTRRDLAFVLNRADTA